MLQNVSIPLSGQISGNIDLSQTRLSAIFVPVINSCDTYLQGSFDTTSANFARVQMADLGQANISGDLHWATAAGSRMALWAYEWPPIAYVRFETGVPQTAARSFQVLSR